MNRRDFIKTSAAGATVVSLGAGSVSADDTSDIEEYVSNDGYFELVEGSNEGTAEFAVIEDEVRPSTLGEHGRIYPDTSTGSDRSTSRPDPTEWPDLLDGMNGDGSPGTPYKVTNDRELQAIREEPSAHYELANSIMSGMEEWEDAPNDDAVSGAGYSPIMDFTGSLDGNGYNIDRMSIDRDGSASVAMFAQTNGAEIKNLTITNVSVRAGSKVAGLVVDATDTVIENVHLFGNTGPNTNDVLSVGADTGEVGGLVANAVNTEIRDCSTAVEVWDESSSVTGGLVGELDADSLVAYSSADGDVIASSATKVGGLVGVNNGTIEYSYCVGNIEADSELGGLIGTNNGTVERSYATPTLTASNGNAGQLIGTHSVEGSLSYNYAIESPSYSAVGSGSVGKAEVKTLSSQEMTGEEAKDNMAELPWGWEGGYYTFNGSYPRHIQVSIRYEWQAITDGDGSSYGEGKTFTFEFTEDSLHTINLYIYADEEAIVQDIYEIDDGVRSDGSGVGNTGGEEGGLTNFEKILGASGLGFLVWIFASYQSNKGDSGGYDNLNDNNNGGGNR